MWEHGVLDSRLTVIKQVDDYIRPNGQHMAVWLCECSCEEHNRIVVSSYDLTSGHTKSCGCLNSELSSKRNKKYNSYDMESKSYGVGYTNKGEEFWFDKEDFDLIKNYCWHYNSNGYVRAYSKTKQGHIYLHNLVMGNIEDENEVNHKTHLPRHENKYDNRKQNLEVVTRSENNMNRALALNNTSGTTGVCWDNKYNKWLSQIKVKYKTIYIGHFTNKDDAIKARKEAEIKYFGEHRYDANN